MENTAVIDNPTTLEPVVEVKNEFLEATLKRALEEVNALEMTQQILAMVERSMQKPGVKDYNNTGVKKYLNELYSLSPHASSDEVNGMEFIFLQEVQLWRSALAQRDSYISATDLRYYCESCRPPLSGQALLSLARFYRGLPSSERTTSKFDMIVTRIFSLDEEDGTRRMGGPRHVIAETLNGYYKEWLGISPQNTIEEVKMDEAVAQFAEFIAKAQAADNFQMLIEDSFFGVIKNYKKELSQVFYAPRVAAAAIDCNVKVGNRFIELLDQYRDLQKAEGKKGPEPLDPLLEQAVSETTNKTLQVVYEAQKNHAKLEAQREMERLLNKETLALPEAKAVENYKPATAGGFLGINKWLLAGGFAAVLLSGGFYAWTELGSAQATSMQTAQKVDSKDMPGAEYFTSFRQNNEALYGFANAKWNTLDGENKKKVVEQLVASGKGKGFKEVSILNTEGKVVGTGSENGISVF